MRPLQEEDENAASICPSRWSQISNQGQALIQTLMHCQSPNANIHKTPRRLDTERSGQRRLHIPSASIP